MNRRGSPTNSVLFCRALLLISVCAVSTSAFAQQKPVPPAERKLRPHGSHGQLPEHRAQSIDAGDYFTASDGKRSLNRLAGAMVVRVNDKLDRVATVKALGSSGDVLDG